MNMKSVLEAVKKSNVPELAPGDTVKVKVRIVEGEKVRTQAYQGVVIRIRHGVSGGSFTVRRVAFGIGIERTFPMNSPSVEGVEVLRHGKVRRAKLYYLRGLSTKASRIKERRVKVLVPEEGQTVEQAQAEADAQALAQSPAEAAAPVQAQAPAQAPVQEASKAEVKETPKAQAAEAPKQEAPPAQEKPS